MAIRATREQMGEKYEEDLIKGYLSGGKGFSKVEVPPEEAKRMEEALAKQPPHDYLWKNKLKLNSVNSDQKRSVTMQTEYQYYPKIEVNKFFYFF